MKRTILLTFLIISFSFSLSDQSGAQEPGKSKPIYSPAICQSCAKIKQPLVIRILYDVKKK